MTIDYEQIKSLSPEAAELIRSLSAEIIALRQDRDRWQALAQVRSGILADYSDLVKP
jgi:hypothetical protein